jgi:hypothetical protein
MVWFPNHNTQHYNLDILSFVCSEYVCRVNTRNDTVVCSANLEPDWSLGAPDQLSVQYVETRAVQFAQNGFQHLEARVMNEREWQEGKKPFFM